MDSLEFDPKGTQGADPAVQPLVLVLDRDGVIVTVNEACESASGAAAGNLVGAAIWDLLLSPEYLERARLLFDDLLRGAPGNTLEHDWHRASGEATRILWQNTPIRGKNGNLIQVVCVGVDQYLRTHLATAQSRFNRAIETFGACCEAMHGANTEQELLDAVCRVIHDTDGYRLVWIGLAEDDAEKSVRPVAQAGFEAGYLETLNITWSYEARGLGPTGTAIRTGAPAVARNIPTDPRFVPWRDAAVKRGYASSLALPLFGGRTRAFGALNIYSATPDAFDPEEVAMLEEVAKQVGYGLLDMVIRRPGPPLP